MNITAEQFKAAVGREPKDNELAKCNCPTPGKTHHWFCGWDKEKNLPNFMVVTGAVSFTP